MPPLSWVERSATLGRDPVERTRSATADECRAVAEALGVPTCEMMAASYKIEPIGRDRFLLSGQLDACLLRICGVTLESFPETISEPFQVEFWPPEQIGGARPDVSSGAELDVAALEGDDPEPIHNGRLYVGAYLYQVLAAAIDPFPRHPDAEMETTEAGGSDIAADAHPFAVLRQLRANGNSGRNGEGNS